MSTATTDDTGAGTDNRRPWPNMITRATALDDLAVRPGRVTCDTCGRDATGRVIDAYAAVFNQEAEIHDEQGHYIEEIDAGAWNKRLSDVSRSRMGLRDIGVFYHHGMTLYSTPSELGSHPVGHPLAIRADGHGLLTSTHYGTSDVAERTFTDLVEGNLTGHSFTGRIFTSDPPRVPRAQRGGSLPKIRRKELGLAEYGPTPIPFYAGAQMVGQRADRLGTAAAGDQGGPDGQPGPAVLSQADIARRIRLARLTGKLG